MILDLGPLYACALCDETYYVASAMRAVHIIAKHELIAATFLAEGANFDLLFVEVDATN